MSDNEQNESSEKDVCKGCQGRGHAEWVVYCWVYDENDKAPEGCKLYRIEESNQ